jgi:hypothetical protein
LAFLPTSATVIGDVPVSTLMATPAKTRARSNWQRRLLEAVVALLAFAIWGKLAYIGGFRLLARINGVAIGGSPVLDVLSLFIGVSGSIAGVAAVWALGMRIMGRTPQSLVGAPDDSPEDYPQHDRTDERAARI